MATNAVLIAKIEPAVQLGTERPVDLVHLARQTCGNKDLETEVLGLFVRQSRTLLERIALAPTATACFEAAHRLKGSARAIGAASVADCAEAIELAVNAGGEIAAPLADLTRAVMITNSFIADLID